jgi:hypothetical protein
MDVPLAEAQSTKISSSPDEAQSRTLSTPRLEGENGYLERTEVIFKGSSGGFSSKDSNTARGTKLFVVATLTDAMRVEEQSLIHDAEILLQDLS